MISNSDGWKPTEYEIRTEDPERLSVGKLNQVVRALREALYQKRLRIQELEELLRVRQLAPDTKCVECGERMCEPGWTCGRCRSRQARGA